MNITEHTKVMIGDLVLTVAKQAAEIDALREQVAAMAAAKAVAAIEKPAPVQSPKANPVPPFRKRGA